MGIFSFFTKIEPTGGKICDREGMRRHKQLRQLGPSYHDVNLFHRPTLFPSVVTVTNSNSLLTFRHRAGADIRCHAAAARVGRVVAGVDLNLVAGEVAQAGDDSGLLGVDGYHRLCAFKGFFVLILGDACAPGWAGGGGEEGVGSVGDSHHGASLSRASRQGKAGLK